MDKATFIDNHIYVGTLAAATDEVQKFIMKNTDVIGVFEKGKDFIDH